MPSTAIRSFHYRPKGRELEIIFITGRRYVYFNVRPETVEAFRAATSKGAFFNRQIRPFHEYRELSHA